MHLARVIVSLTLSPHSATPFFLSRPSPTIKTKISYFVALTCTVIGLTPPNVTWYRNSELLPAETTPNSRISITVNVTDTTVESILSLRLVEKADEGVYTCQASNEDGVNSTSTTLTVRGGYVTCALTGIPNIVVVNVGVSEHCSGRCL